MQPPIAIVNRQRVTSWPRDPDSAAGCRRHRQDLCRRSRPQGGLVRPAAGRSACPRRGERRRKVHADQNHHRRRAARRRHPACGRPGRAAHGPRHVARARHRRHLPAAGAVSPSDRGRERRAGARRRRPVAEGGLAPPSRGCGGASRQGRIGDRSGPDRRHAQHARAADRRDRQGHRRQRAHRRHGRADGVADHPGSRPALSGDRPAARVAGRGDLHLAPARGDLRGGGSDHGAARRPDRGYAGGRGRGARRADPVDGRPRDLGGVPQGIDRDRRAGARSRGAHECRRRASAMSP